MFKGLFGKGKATRAEVHLREIWETLIQEHQLPLARSVEGVLAELTDRARGERGRLRAAARAWKALFANARGLSDFGIWREDEAERIRVNREFQRQLDSVHALLR